jgi:hypothetical protein
MNPDEAKVTLKSAASDALRSLFLSEFNNRVMGTPHADDHFEKGFQILLDTEIKSMEIAARLTGAI